MTFGSRSKKRRSQFPLANQWESYVSLGVLLSIKHYMEEKGCYLILIPGPLLNKNSKCPVTSRTHLQARLWAQLWTHLQAQLWAQLQAQLRAQLQDQLRAELQAELQAQLRAHLQAHLWAQLRTHLQAQLSAQLWVQLWTHSQAQLWAQLQA